MNKVICGNALEVLPGMDAESIHSVVTSPPYWGLRSYGEGAEMVFGGEKECRHEWSKGPPCPTKVGSHGSTETIKYDSLVEDMGKPAGSQFCSLCGAWRGQFGLEPTPEMYVEHTLEFLRAIRRVLRDDGTVWWNIGDSYYGGKGKSAYGWNVAHPNRDSLQKPHHHPAGMYETRPSDLPQEGLKPKDLVMIPFRVALAAQADGWWVRSVIIWCLSGGVKLYAQTQKGTMPSTIKDLARLDPSTVKLWNGDKWTQVVAWHESPRPENPLEIELRSGEKIGCTPGHVWPTRRGNIRADQLVIGDIIKSTVLPEPWEPQPSYLSYYLGWFVGLYIAEGSRRGDTIQISSHVDEVEGRAKRLRLWVYNVFGGTLGIHKTGGNAAVIRIESKVMNAILDMYVAGRTAKDKHLTRAAWHRNNDFIQELLKGYLDGDGHYDELNDRWRLGFCRNDQWADDLRTICSRLGVQLRLKTSHSAYQHGTRPSYRGEIRFSVSEHHNVKQDTEVVGIGRSRARKFWDIEVEDEPHLFALASGVLTHNSKTNPMPENVRDRPTTSHEYVLLLTKNARYFYDADAIREPQTGNAHSRGKSGLGQKSVEPGQGIRVNTSYMAAMTQYVDVPGGRNKRTVWTISTKPYPEAHFATFPPDLIEPMILTTPTKCCAECGAGWERVVEKAERPIVKDSELDRYGTGQAGVHRKVGQAYQNWLGANPDTTLGFRPTCSCLGKPKYEMVTCPSCEGSGVTKQRDGSEKRCGRCRGKTEIKVFDYNGFGFPAEVLDKWPIKPATLLDLFAGTGTVGQVAENHGRGFTLIELVPEYIPLIKRRLSLAPPKEIKARTKAKNPDVFIQTALPLEDGFEIVDDSTKG